MATVSMTTPVDNVSLHTQTLTQKHTSSCLKKIIGDAVSLRLAVRHNVFQFTFIMSYQLNMVSLSALPCGTPAFSLTAWLCARARRATLSRAFVISLFQGLQHGLAIEPHCGHLGWIQTGDSTRIPPMQPPKAHLSDRAGLPSGLPRSPSLLQLSFLSYSFSRLTKCPWQNRDGSTVDSPSCPPPPSSTSSNKLPANLRNFLLWSFAEVLWKCPPLCMFTGQIMKPDRIL